MSLSSSSNPWPEAWIGASRVVTTSAPTWYSRSIVSLTARSLPGIGVAEKTTVSPARSSTCGWSRYAIRRSADSGSPWEPVETMTTRSGGNWSTSLSPISIPSGMSMCPSDRPMLMFLRIERPTSATLRSSWAAASTTCWTRWMFEAKHVTTIRPLQWWNTRSRFGPTIDSEGEKPGRSAFVESPHSSSSPSRPSSARRETSAGGRLVELVVAGEQDRPELGRQRDSAGVGDRVREVDRLDPERTRVDGVAGRQHVEPRLAQLVLVELGARHRDRQLAAVGDRDARLPQLAQQPRQRAEMVLVAVRDHDRLDVGDALAQVGEVRQHQVDAQLLGGREAQPRVDDDDAPAVLDDGHVLPDLADASQREDAQGPAHPVDTAETRPWRSSIARTAAVSASSASTIGRRSVPASWPSRLSAALTGVGLAVMNSVS